MRDIERASVCHACLWSRYRDMREGEGGGGEKNETGRREGGREEGGREGERM